MIDIAFIAPSNAENNYQELSNKYSAIEPPTWALLLAESCRNKGFKPIIIDCLAESLKDDDVIERLTSKKPRLICFVVYGQNVNAGTTNMSGAVRLADKIKSSRIDFSIGFIGSHVQALPKETLIKEKSIDFVFLNEGVYSLHSLLKLKTFNFEKLKNIPGLAIRDSKKIFFTQPQKVVPNEEMDTELPGYAWDLLPFNKKPLDLYRSPFWHAEYRDEFRSPYAAIQTSIGCQFKCSFCMINLINKNDNSDISIASNYNRMRHWSVEFVEKAFKRLIDLGVHTIRITDEMFLLNKKYYLPILESLIKLNKDDNLKLWAYSRIDTVPSPHILRKVRLAGIKWLCLGIESGNKQIRLEVAKGKFEQVKVENVVQQIEDADINVMGNYIYGLPGDSKESIQETYDLSSKLNTLGWNTYAAMALPGSPLYNQAVLDGVRVPEKYEEFSFHSYETIPLPTKHLQPYEILELRDQKFIEYFEKTDFQEKIVKKFGEDALKNIIEMTKIKLKRKIIEENKLKI